MCYNNFYILHRKVGVVVVMGIVEFMKKIGILIVLVCLLGACSKDDKVTQEKVEEIEKALKVTTDEEYVEDLKNEELVLDVRYSIMEGMRIVILRLTVDKKMTVKQAQELAHEQEKKILAEYPDLLPVVTIIQNEVELYSTSNEEQVESIEAENNVKKNE